MEYRAIIDESGRKKIVSEWFATESQAKDFAADKIAAANRRQQAANLFTNIAAKIESR